MENTTTTHAHVINKTTGFDGKKLTILIVGAASIIALIALAYFAKVQIGQKNEDNALESAVEGTLPSISNNPLEGKPNLNPAESTNPFNKVKTNPFE